MSNWISITPDSLPDVKVAAKVTAFRTSALGEGQSDPAARVIADVVARIRAEISGCATNVLDADPTRIPKDLGSLACRMIVRQMQSRLGVPLKPDELTEQENDLKYLERIAACKVPVAEPDNPITTPEVQALSSMPKIAPRRRHFTHRTEAGL